jgi:hypothetical protein
MKELPFVEMKLPNCSLSEEHLKGLSPFETSMWNLLHVKQTVGYVYKWKSQKLNLYSHDVMLFSQEITCLLSM